MGESSLLTGKLESTNEAYAIAKIAGIKMCESYNRQFSSTHFIDYRSVMPTNLYGPGDNYHEKNSHVIPALLRRFHEAKMRELPKIEIWGSGKPRREFLHVDDLSEGAIHIMNLSKKRFDKNTTSLQSHINIGYGVDIKISDLAVEISRIVNYKGKIEFDISKPDGPKQKLMDSSLINNLGWKPKTSLIDGLKSTYMDFLNNKDKYYSNISNENKKIALITGITGQDGSYLLDFLLDKNYEVHGIKRRSSLNNTQRIENKFKILPNNKSNFFLHNADMTDTVSLTNVVKEVMPDEIYNLAAQSHVEESFSQPEYTANTNGLGALRLLEAIKILNLWNKTKFYQASTSEFLDKFKKKIKKKQRLFILEVHTLCQNCMLIGLQ